MSTTLIITRDNNINNIACVVLAKLFFDDVDYVFTTNKFNLYNTKGYNNVFNIDCTNNNETILDFYESLLLMAPDRVFGSDALRISKDDIKLFINSIHHDTKNKKILKNYLDFCGSHNFINHFEKKFRNNQNNTFDLKEEQYMTLNDIKNTKQNTTKQLIKIDFAGHNTGVIISNKYEEELVNYVFRENSELTQIILFNFNKDKVKLINKHYVPLDLCRIFSGTVVDKSVEFTINSTLLTIIKNEMNAKDQENFKNKINCLTK